MKIRVILSVLVLLAVAQGQQTTTQTPEQEHAAMMKRGDTGMGFSQNTTTHHFMLRKHGGIIQVSANDPKDDVSLDHIRMHLSHVAKMFSEGNFDIPMFIHDRTAPGVPTMKKLHEEIHYHYEETNTGGRITIETENSEGVGAVHDFLRFQITEHKTGDSKAVTDAAPQADSHP